MNAKFVKLPQTQGQREPQQEEKQIKVAQPQQPTPQISRIEKVSQSKAIKGRSRIRHANVNFEMSHIEYKEPETINLDNLTGVFAKYDGMMWGVAADYQYETRFAFGCFYKASENTQLTPFFGAAKSAEIGLRKEMRRSPKQAIFQPSLL